MVYHTGGFVTGGQVLSMHKLRACLTNVHVVQGYMSYERTCITENHVLKVGYVLLEDMSNMRTGCLAVDLILLFLVICDY